MAYNWSILKKETADWLLAAWKQPIQTNAITAWIDKSSNDSKCRFWKEAEGAVDYTVYSVHGRRLHVFAIIWRLQVFENEQVQMVFLNTTLIKSWLILDITLVQQKNVWIIEVATPGNIKIEDKELEMMTKNQYLEIEIERLWH